MPLRSVRMNRFILGFQRRVWWPKWTPLSRSCLMVTTGVIPVSPSCSCAVPRAPARSVRPGARTHVPQHFAADRLDVRTAGSPSGERTREFGRKPHEYETADRAVVYPLPPQADVRSPGRGLTVQGITLADGPDGRRTL